MASLVQQSAVPSSSSKAPASSFKGKAVVIGAGPAGFAASMYLARKGFKVDVFDNRPPPNEASDKAISTWVMALNSRSTFALNDLCPGLPCINPELVPHIGFFSDGKVRNESVATKDVYSSMYGVDRQVLSRQMYQAASQQYPDSITWHFEHELAGLDIKARRVQAVPTTAAAAAAKEGAAAPEAAQKLELGYDLLVGADGVNSAVRRQLEGQDPSFSSRELGKSHIRHKTFVGLPKDVEGIEAFAPGFHTHLPWQYVYFTGSKGVDNTNAVVVWIDSDGTVKGVINGEEGRFADKESLRKSIQQHSPLLPAKWADLICEQVAGPNSAKAHSNRIVQCSRLNGPRLVLLGDAAHSITPANGQGCNMALETAKVFGRVLEECGDDLDSLPQRFSDARMPDIRGMQAFEYMGLIFKTPSSDRAQFPLMDRLCAMGVFVPVLALSMILTSKMPFLFPKGSPIFAAFKDARIGYGKMWSTVKLVALGLYSVLAAVGVGIVMAGMRAFA